MQTVTIQQTANAQYVPSTFGFGGSVYQPSIKIVTTHTGAEIRVIDTVSEIVTHHPGMVSISDVSGEVPADLTTHDDIAWYWFMEAKRMAADFAEVMLG